MNVTNRGRFGIVLTHTGARNRMLEMPWAESHLRIHQSDSLILSADGWRAAADGDAVVWDGMERRLLISFYANPPAVIAIVGRPCGREGPDARVRGREEVRRLVRRIRSLMSPAPTLGFWTDANGSLEGRVEVWDPIEQSVAGLSRTPDPAA